MNNEPDWVFEANEGGIENPDFEDGEPWDHADAGQAADVVAAALVAAYGTTTLEEAVEKLRWTLGKRQQR